MNGKLFDKQKKFNNRKDWFDHSNLRALKILLE